MESHLRSRAEARLIEAAAGLRLGDPRPPCRERLRRLRESHPDEFRRAIEHYENTALPAIATGDALAAWVDYAAFLAAMSDEGQLTVVDGTGRARPYAPPPQPGALILHIPDEPAGEVLVVARPEQPTAAQEATLDLLAERRLSL